MTWKNLLDAERIRRHQTSKAELDELRAAITVKLSDAQSTSISADTRYATAYGAAMLLAKMTLACAGYRLNPKAGGHHKTAFEALPLAVGHSGRSLADYFDVCRRKRNEIDYDRAYVVSDAETTEIIDRVGTLSQLVEDWITANHPNLTKS